MGSLTVNSGAGSTLNVTASTAPVDTAYGLSLSGATLSGNLILNVANNGAGLGTVTMGAIADTGTGYGLTKTGAGTLILSAANTYRGTTTVNGGTLRLVDASGTSNNNIPASSLITVGSGGTFNVTGLKNGRLILASGQTLTGAGTVNGAVTASAGSIIAGASGSTFNLAGGLTLDDQSHSSFALGAPNGSGNPLVSVSGGTFSLAGGHVVDLAGAAQVGTYKLYGYTSGAAAANQFSIGTNTAGFFNYMFSVVANAEVDLIVTQPYNSAEWNYDDNGAYGDITKWSPAQLPIGAGLTATFGNGVTTTVGSAPVLTVLVDGAETVGSLVFNNTNGLGYILGNDQVAGHGITLNNNAAGATINVSTTTPQQIQANLMLADNAVFNIAPGGSLLVTVGAISETGGTRSLLLTGGGSLTIDTPSTYTGGTTITNGILTTTPTGTLGSGPLAVNATGSVSSVVNLGNNQTVASLSGNVSGGSTARVNVSGGTTLTVNQATNTSYAGVLALQAGPTAASAGAFTKSAAGALEIQGAPSLGNNSSLNINGGSLKFNVSGGAATIGTGVVVTVTNAANLELAGPVAALASGGSPLNRANIVNNSTSAAGLHVTGTSQQVGGIDGTGTTKVEASSDLTANHIVQSALIIGGIDATHLGTVTIAASDDMGNPLVGAGGLALAGSLNSGAPPSTSTLLAGGSSGLGVGVGGPSLESTSLGGASAAVPEPTTMFLSLFGLAALGALARRRIR
jgi:autotransporter-associated beta strand protein